MLTADASSHLAAAAQSANTSSELGFRGEDPAKKARERATGRERHGAETGRDAADRNHFDTNHFDTGRRRFLGGTGLGRRWEQLSAAPCRFPEAAAFRRPTQAAPAAAPPPAAAAKGPQHLKFPGKNEGLVVLGERPLVAETPESLLDDDTTPIEKFYIRNNGQIPEETRIPTPGRSPSTARSTPSSRSRSAS